MSFILTGVAQFEAALTGIVEQADRGARTAVTAGAHALEAKTKQALTAYTHRRGEPTNSPPGSPPALVGGALRRSIKVDGPQRVGTASWQATVGPTIIYGRIQELGGTGGRGSKLPPRPYLAPSLRALIDSGELWKVFETAWAKAGH